MTEKEKERERVRERDRRTIGNELKLLENENREKKANNESQVKEMNDE